MSNGEMERGWGMLTENGVHGQRQVGGLGLGRLGETGRLSYRRVVGVPSVHGELLVHGHGHHRRQRQLRIGVGGYVDDRRVGEELHCHAYVVRNGREHHGRLKRTNIFFISTSCNHH